MRATGTMTVAALALASTLASADTPFAGLERSASVSTTRPGDAVWISVASATHTAKLPGHERSVGPPDHLIWLQAHCAMGAEGAPPHPVRASVYLRNHPEQPGAYTIIHPMHWVLGLIGRQTDRVQVQARLGDGPWHESEFVRPRTDWSAGKPGSDIAMPAAAVVAALASDEAITLEVRGEGIHVEGRFKPSNGAQQAARLVQAHCPVERGG